MTQIRQTHADDLNDFGEIFDLLYLSVAVVHDVRDSDTG